MEKLKITIEDKDRVLFQTGADGNSIIPTDIDEARLIIHKLRHNISFLNGVISVLEETDSIENPSAQIIHAYRFKGGLGDATFKLDDDFYENQEISKNTLRFITDTDIYYHDKIVVKKGGAITYFHRVQTWDYNDMFKFGEAKVVLDLRPPNVYGSDFDLGLLNDGKESWGADFSFLVTPTYDTSVTIS
jgi:hypothetical protein